MTLKQVMTSESGKGTLFSTPTALVECDLHSSCQIVITDTSWDAFKILESLDVTVEKALLLLSWKTHDEGSP